MDLQWQRLEGRSGHDAGRELLAQMLHCTPQVITDHRGKPYLSNSSLHFSISHTKEHIFCCVSARNVGIDAEEMTRKPNLQLAERILSPTERERWQRASDPHDALLRLWVLKESYAKLIGRGWGNYLSQTNFDPDDPRILQIDGCYVAILEE